MGLSGSPYALSEIKPAAALLAPEIVSDDMSEFSAPRRTLKMVPEEDLSEDALDNGGRKLQACTNGFDYKYLGRLETYAVDYLCRSIYDFSLTSLLEPEIILKLNNSGCRTPGEVVVVREPNTGAVVPVALTPGVVPCNVTEILIKAVRNMCYLFKFPEKLACQGDIDDTAKASKTHNFVTGIGLQPIGEYWYQVRLKSNCTSVDNPVFNGWFLSGEIYRGVPCFNATNVAGSIAMNGAGGNGGVGIGLGLGSIAMNGGTGGVGIGLPTFIPTLKKPKV